MDVKGEILLKLFNKSKLRNGTKTYLEQKFFSSYSQFKKLGFSASLSCEANSKNQIKIKLFAMLVRE